jgi:hypothetical protein
MTSNGIDDAMPAARTISSSSRENAGNHVSLVAWLASGTAGDIASAAGLEGRAAAEKPVADPAADHHA